MGKNAQKGKEKTLGVGLAGVLLWQHSLMAPSCTSTCNEMTMEAAPFARGWPERGWLETRGKCGRGECLPEPGEATGKEIDEPRLLEKGGVEVPVFLHLQEQ